MLSRRPDQDFLKSRFYLRKIKKVTTKSAAYCIVTGTVIRLVQVYGVSPRVYATNKSDDENDGNLLSTVRQQCCTRSADLRSK